MMKLGEAANRMMRLDVLAPDGIEWALAVANRNFIIHQYDQIDRGSTGLAEVARTDGLPSSGCARP
ncbi:hypothetical protein GY21_16930 [Cryobacterium roopkundense]|uniref:Uncharacterized protein with HEPN domain n=1 Tax=Cryobacterium roopkundense TaxID=1001240 RepID=A0A099J2C8_9MICO|nr:hypothetical protein [Cryobacterium roopkundense]KGJ72210.1 hypothetical protein GY21_16930 [Cryobacterium roopkundense]MBB5641968.1 uncharacterized protein with HEPN domain [Cryobacterium roopkundense]